MRRIVLAFAALAIMLSTAACGGRPYLFTPPGERVGSCSGRLRGDGRTGKFTVEAFRYGDDVQLYLSVPRRFIRRAYIEEMDIDEGRVHFEVAGGREVSGEVRLHDIEVAGAFNPFGGAFHFEFDE